MELTMLGLVKVVREEDGDGMVDIGYIIEETISNLYPDRVDLFEAAARQV